MSKIFYVSKNNENNENINITILNTMNLEDICINIEEYKNLLISKCKIDKNLKLWDYNKKKKNKYELIYVSNRNKQFNIANYKPISRSYFKLWEILHDIDYLKYLNNNRKINTAHLCEGPGGFIEATINYCRKKIITIDNIHAITLKDLEKETLNNNDIPNWNIEDKMIKDNNIKIHYGKDLTGNLYNIQNILDFIIKTGKNNIDLITADGGLDYSIDYNKQEQLTYRLLLCEIVTALSVLKKGGVFIFKIFDIGTLFTIEMIYLVWLFFDDIEIIKPDTSRMANSEKYVICKGYTLIDNTNLNKLYGIISEYDKIYPFHLFESINGTFIDCIKKFNTMYINYQINNIENTLIKSTHQEYKEQINNALNWCHKYKIEINKNNKYNNILNNIR